MSNGEDEDAPTEADESDSETSEEITEETLSERLDAAAASLDEAETEADLDAVESTLDGIEADLEVASLPEAEDEDEDDPRDALESRLSDLRDDLESQRGPYAADVVETVEDARARIEETRWTEQGKGEVVDVVAAFVDSVEEILAETITDTPQTIRETAPVLDDVASSIEAADLDPDDDAETIAALVEAADALEQGLEDAQEWDDLETREQLMAEGFYDVLGHYKDYPPEWSALKEHEKRGNTDMILLALDKLGSDFMEEHCLESLRRMGRIAATEDAVEAMLQRANKRDKSAITILGKMECVGAVETLIGYVDTDKDPGLQKVTFKALGEIGDPRAVQPLANKLVMDNDNVRPYAARALGLIGDTRAVEPLADALKTDDNANVRSSAAWALRQIGTKRALEAAVDHGSDDAFVVQAEIDKARDALEAPTPA
ncbi:HEAT repeat domain-containing protein [Haloferacaceae archaeon DSL9]